MEENMMKSMWKKYGLITRVIMCFAMSVLLFGIRGIEVSAASTGTITADSAKVRKEANTTSEALGSVVKGDTVSITSEKTDSAGMVWYQVTTSNNTQGYIRSDLMSKAADAGNSTTAPADNSAVNTAVKVGANTTVTPIQSQAASVTSDNVRVRADASTKGEIVTTIQKTTAITAVAQATDAEGKTWYQVNFIVNGGDVSGFIRSDYLQLSAEVVVVDPTATPDEAVPEEVPEEPAEPEVPVNNDYELKYEANPEGVEEWYLHFKAEGYKSKLSEILEAAESNSANVEKAEGQLKTQKIIIIVLAIVLVVLALAVTLLLFKIRDLYYEDFEDYDDEPQRGASKASNPSNPRAVKPGSGNRPAQGSRPSGGNASQTQRPSQGTRPAQGSRPSQGTGTKPAAPQSGARKPEGSQGTRPVGAAQSRPTTRPVSQSQRPVGEGAPRPSGGTQRPVATAQRPTARPAEANGEEVRRPRPTTAPNNSQNRNTQGETKWKSRNFMTEDDEFEFEFLNWDGEDKS